MSFKSLIDNDVVIIILAVIVAMYASMVRVELPEYIKTLFRNNIFRIVFLSLLLIYSFNAAPHVALIIALVFVLTLYYLNYEETKENFAHLERFRNMKIAKGLREHFKTDDPAKPNGKLKFSR
jgi:hypothetical protein